MAFSSLDAVRANLNIELGVTADTTDNRFGTTAQRNYALQEAIRRLWPRMARLTKESITIVADQEDYALSTVRDVIRVEVYDSDGALVTDFAGKWRAWWDEEDATPVNRLWLPMAVAATESYTMQAIGYAPYSVPTSSPPSSSGNLDLQPEDEWVIIAGARALLYRRLLNTFIVYERHANENRQTSLSAADILGLAREAEGQFERAVSLRKRRMVTGKHAFAVR